MDYNIFIIIIIAVFCDAVAGEHDPIIKVHPSDVYVIDNHPVTLSCKAEGNPSPLITWYKDGVPLSKDISATAQENNRVQLDDGSLFFLRITKKHDIGSYHCEATNPLTNRSVASKSAFLKAAVLRNDFREHPANFEVLEGEEIFLTCKPPRGTPEPKMKWKKNGKDLNIDENGRYFMSSSNGLRIVKSMAQDSALYSCVAYNIAGEKESQPAVVVIKSKSFLTQSSKLPRDITVNEGKDALFSCPVPEHPQSGVSWRKSNGDIPENRSQLYGDSFKITSVRSSDEGVYICTVVNGSDVKEFKATLSVHTVPTVYVLPKELIVSQGREVTVSCHVTGSPPPSIYWNYESSSTFVSPSSSDGRIRVTENGTLIIDSVEFEDSGDYFCHAMSLSGKSSAKVKIIVKELEFRLPPVIVYGPQNQTLPIGDTATLLCQASGDPEPEIMWWKNNELLLPNEPLIFIREDGTLEINKLKKSDTGVYTCFASSASGETKAMAYLQVENQRNTLVLFSKSPGISTFPGQPSAPAASEIKHSSLKLSWVPSPERGSSEVEGYVIEMHCIECQQKTWNQLRIDSPTPSAIIPNLLPDSTYFFVIRSRNSHGVSAPSPTSVPIKTRGQRGLNYQREGVYEFLTNQQLVQPLSAEAISSTAIRVDWGFVEDFKDVIEGFIVKYQDIDRSGPVQSLRSDRVNSVVLEDLKKFTWYEINVHPYFELIEGMSTPARVRTFEDLPQEPPQHIQASWHGNDSLLIIWEHPSPAGRNGVLKGYKIYVTNNDTKTTRTTQVDGSVESLMMSNMAKHRVYSVKVSAFNKVGESPLSEEVYVGKHAKSTMAIPVSPSIVNESWFIYFIIIMTAIIVIITTCSCVVCLLRRRNKNKKCTDGNFIGVTVQACSDNLMKTDPKPFQGGSQFPLLSNHSAEQRNNNPCCYDNNPASDFESKNSMHARSESQGHTYQTLDGAPCTYPHTWNPSNHLMTPTGCNSIINQQQQQQLQASSVFFPTNDIPNPVAYMIRHPPSNCTSLATTSDKNSELYVSGGSSDGSGSHCGNGCSDHVSKCLRQQNQLSSNVSSGGSSIRSNVNDSIQPLLYCGPHGNRHHDDGNSSRGSSNKSSQAYIRHYPSDVQPINYSSSHYDDVTEHLPSFTTNAHQKLFKHCNTPVSMVADTDDESTTTPCLHSMDDFSTISSMKSDEYSHQPSNNISDKFHAPTNQNELILRDSSHIQFKCSEQRFRRPQISTFAQESHSIFHCVT